MNVANETRHTSTFRSSARIVEILGEQMIRDQAVGLIELVKNSYDADATEVTVELLHLSDQEQSTVVVADNGCGMTLEDIQERWLSLAVDHKDRAKREDRRTPLGRLPIGEKGVGRLAVQQLGRKLELITRSKGHPEIVVQTDWDAFQDGESYLDDVSFPITEREPQEFVGDTTGTVIRILHARSRWTGTMVRNVHQALRRLQSPLREDRGAFRVVFRCPDYPELENTDPTDLLHKAHYEFHCLVTAGDCDFEYLCQHPAVEPRKKEGNKPLLSLARDQLQDREPACGDFLIHLYVWDRTRDYLQASEVPSKELDALCGVSIFRDGLRILPYGDQGDDWLLLDQDRIQAPSKKIGNNQVIGLVEFDQSSSNLQLRDKANREGLIENDAFLDLRALTKAAILHFTSLWLDDRPDKKQKKAQQEKGGIRGAKEIAEALSKTARDDIPVPLPPAQTPPSAPEARKTTEAPAEDPVVSQKEAVERLLQEIEGAEETLKDEESRLDLLLKLSATGMAAERVVHEFGRHTAIAVQALRELKPLAGRTEKAGDAYTRLEASLETLRAEFRILSPYDLGRAQRTREVSVQELADLAIELNRVQLDDYLIQAEILGDDWPLKVRPTPLLQILDNLLHNACYWVSTRVGDEQRRVGFVLLPERSTVLVADSGPGIDPEVASSVFASFFSTKVDGKGLGLYISAEIASRLGATLRLADQGDRSDLPEWATGAVFVLEFQNG